jgi:pimeloyl-ACP methyl ester carboxylesterase
VSVEAQTLEIEGSPLYLRSAAPPPGALTLLYLHGIPTTSEDWLSLLERTGGIAPDLPGFGRSGKGGQLDLTARGQARLLALALDQLAPEPLHIVAHDSAAPVAALLSPRAARTTLIAPDFGPPAGERAGRILRTPALGEIAIGSLTRRGLARHLRRRAADPQVWTPERVEAVWRAFDHGTQRAVLRIHRDPERWGAHSDEPGPAPAHGQPARTPGPPASTLAGVGRWEWLASEAAAERIASLLLEG